MFLHTFEHRIQSGESSGDPFLVHQRGGEHAVSVQKRFDQFNLVFLSA